MEMETKRELICIGCPVGCPLTVELNEAGEVISVAGNTCKRGDDYARTECTNPVRSLTTTVKVSGGVLPVVPVKSASPIPKGKLLDAVAALRGVTVKAPVAIGDILVKDLLGTGVDIVATNAVEAK